MGLVLTPKHRCTGVYPMEEFTAQVFLSGIVLVLGESASVWALLSFTNRADEVLTKARCVSDYVATV